MEKVGGGVGESGVSAVETRGGGTGEVVPCGRQEAVRGMSAAEAPVGGGGEPLRGPERPSGLLDVLGVASVVLDSQGRVVLWSPQAEQLFGYSAREALGQYAARIMVHEQHIQLVGELFA